MTTARMLAEHVAIGVERQHSVPSQITLSETGRPSPMLEGDAKDIVGNYLSCAETTLADTRPARPEAAVQPRPQ